MKSLLAAALFSALVVPAQAGPFTLFIYEDPDQLALRPGIDDAALAYWSAYDAFSKEMAAAGVLRGGSALGTGAPVVLVNSQKGEPSAQPYARSELALGGYFQIDVPSEADAIAWAEKLPVAGGVVEVRAGYPAPGMNM